MRSKTVEFIKKEMILCISGVLAVMSALFVHPDAEYAGYIDYRVLAILFSLMTVVGGLQKLGILSLIAKKLIKGIKSTMGLSVVLITICFFSSMLITNDVALITFVPFTIMILKMTGNTDKMAWIISLQTIAANLGSMLTPIGNPQNLYLYSLSGMSFWEFTVFMLPYAAISLVLLIICAVCGKKDPVTITQETISEEEKTEPIANAKGPSLRRKIYTCIYIVLGLVCIGTVIRLIPWQITVAVVIAVVLIADRGVFKSVDYCLLITFVNFFVFIGNVKRIEEISTFIASMINGHELFMGIAASQIISNVPAAILLSGFTCRWKALILGTDIGGLGTLIASLASLISYKCYVNFDESRRPSVMNYMAVFTLLNMLFLAVLCVVAYYAPL